MFPSDEARHNNLHSKQNQSITVQRQGSGQTWYAEYTIGSSTLTEQPQREERGRDHVPMMDTRRT